MKKKISVVIPILNEKKNILKLVNELKKSIKSFNYEVIFVDDNSTDGSIEILKKIKEFNGRFNFIINTGIRDLTQSCFKGILKSKNKIIVIMDGDLQHNPKYIGKMYAQLVNKKKDIVIASRNFDETSTSSLSIIRTTFSKILILMLRIISGKNYVDPMSGYFMFKKKIFTKNKNKFFGKGYKILADFIYNVPNLRISEITISFRRRNKGNSKMNFRILIILIIFMFKKLIKNQFQSKKVPNLYLL